VQLNATDLRRAGRIGLIPASSVHFRIQTEFNSEWIIKIGVYICQNYSKISPAPFFDPRCTYLQI